MLSSLVLVVGRSKCTHEIRHNTIQQQPSLLVLPSFISSCLCICLLRFVLSFSLSWPLIVNPCFHLYLCPVLPSSFYVSYLFFPLPGLCGSRHVALLLSPWWRPLLLTLTLNLTLALTLTRTRTRTLEGRQCRLLTEWVVRKRCLTLTLSLTLILILGLILTLTLTLNLIPASCEHAA